MAKQILARLAVGVFGVVMALGVLEVGLRGWFSTQGTESERVMYLYDRATIDAKSAEFVGIPYLNYTLNPNREDVDERGIRGVPTMPVVPKPDGVFRIVALGGSTTYGHGLTRRDAWPYVLQAVLRDHYGYGNVEVINLGVPGYNSLNSLINLETRGLALEPDLVITYDGVNDAAIRIYEDPACYQGDMTLFGIGIDQGVWQYSGGELPASALYRVLAIRFGWMEDPTTLNSRLAQVGWCANMEEDGHFLERLGMNPPIYFERNLKSMAAVAQAGGAQMLFMSFALDTNTLNSALAADSSLEGTQALLAAVADQNALMQEIAGETGAFYLDLASVMTDSDYFQGDHIHQTAQGTARQAEIIAAFLDEQGVMPK